MVGCGFIGHHVVLKLLEQGHEVSVITRASPVSYNRKLLLFPDVPWFVYNANSTEIHLESPACEYDTIIYTASTPEAKTIENNIPTGTHGMITGPWNILRSIKTNRFVYLSSSMAYGEFHNLKPRETDPLTPIEPYGILKAASEELIKYQTNHIGVEYTIIRPSAVYGPRDKIQRVISKFMSAARSNKELQVIGNHSLDFTYVEDLADGIILACTHQAAANETFNMTRGKAETIGYAAQCVINTVGKGNIVFYDHDPLFPVRGALDITKAKTLLGYNPRTNLKDGIEKYWLAWQ